MSPVVPASTAVSAPVASVAASPAAATRIVLSEFAFLVILLRLPAGIVTAVVTAVIVAPTTAAATAGSTVAVRGRGVVPGRRTTSFAVRATGLPTFVAPPAPITVAAAVAAFTTATTPTVAAVPVAATTSVATAISVAAATSIAAAISVAAAFPIAVAFPCFADLAERFIDPVLSHHRDESRRVVLVLLCFPIVGFIFLSLTQLSIASSSFARLNLAGFFDPAAGDLVFPASIVVIRPALVDVIGPVDRVEPDCAARLRSWREGRRLHLIQRQKIPVTPERRDRRELGRLRGFPGELQSLETRFQLLLVLAEAILPRIPFPLQASFVLVCLVAQAIFRAGAFLEESFLQVLPLRNQAVRHPVALFLSALYQSPLAVALQLAHCRSCVPSGILRPGDTGDNRRQTFVVTSDFGRRGLHFASGRGESSPLALGILLRLIQLFPDSVNRHLLQVAEPSLEVLPCRSLDTLPVVGVGVACDCRSEREVHLRPQMSDKLRAVDRLPFGRPIVQEAAEQCVRHGQNLSDLPPRQRLRQPPDGVDAHLVVSERRRLVIFDRWRPGAPQSCRPGVERPVSSGRARSPWLSGETPRVGRRKSLRPRSVVAVQSPSVLSQRSWIALELPPWPPSRPWWHPHHRGCDQKFRGRDLSPTPDRSQSRRVGKSTTHSSLSPVISSSRYSLIEQLVPLAGRGAVRRGGHRPVGPAHLAPHGRNHRALGRPRCVCHRGPCCCDIEIHRRSRGNRCACCCHDEI